MSSAETRLRIAVHNMGCRLNRVEADVIAASFEEAGCLLTDEHDADVIVINTCAVTGEAEAKCRKTIRHAAQLPHHPLVLATGCIATLCADELEALGERVHVEADKRRVTQRVFHELGVDSSQHSASLSRRRPTPTGRLRPGIKIQDGCDNRCTYCIVWKARGRARSFDPNQVISEVNAAVTRGAHEVVLSGINLGSYRWQPSLHGDHMIEEMRQRAVLRLPDLLKMLLDTTAIERIRLSSIEPPDVNEQLIEIMASSCGRIAPYLHVCLQSGCDRTLARMGRLYRRELYRDVVSKARSALPTLAVGCDLIVGFPGESDADFEESLAFCREMNFAKMHIFRYSPRPGTPASSLSNQVPASLKAARSQRMRSMADDMRKHCASMCLGREERVLVQSPGRAITEGLFDVLVDPQLPVNSMHTVRPHTILDDATLTAR